MREFQDEEGRSRRLPPTRSTWCASSARFWSGRGKRPVLNVDEEAVTVGQMIDYVRRRLIMEDRPVALSSLLKSTARSGR